MLLFLTFQGKQTDIYFPKGHDNEGTQLQQSGLEAAPSNPLVDTGVTQISPNQVTHCKCSFTEMDGTVVL